MRLYSKIAINGDAALSRPYYTPRKVSSYNVYRFAQKVMPAASLFEVLLIQCMTESPDIDAARPLSPAAGRAAGRAYKRGEHGCARPDLFYIKDFPVISGGTERPMRVSRVGAMSHSLPSPERAGTGFAAM